MLLTAPTPINDSRCNHKNGSLLNVRRFFIKRDTRKRGAIISLIHPKKKKTGGEKEERKSRKENCGGNYIYTFLDRVFYIKIIDLFTSYININETTLARLQCVLPHSFLFFRKC